MALKKPGTAPAFEPEGNGADVIEMEAPATPAVQPVIQPAADVAQTAIAKAQNTSVGAARKFTTVLLDLKNALPNLDYGTLPRIVSCNGGGLQDGDKVKVGSWIKLHLLSYNDLWTISPGSDTTESKKLVRYSLDGQTIPEENGMLITEYIAELQDKYPNASSKKYTELVGVLLGCEKGEYENIGEMVKVSLSPQSRTAFEGYQMQRSVKVQMGSAPAEGSEIFFIRAVGKVNGAGKDYVLLKTTDK